MFLFSRKKRQRLASQSKEAELLVADSVKRLEKATTAVKNLNTAIKKEDVVFNLYYATHARKKQK